MSVKMLQDIATLLVIVACSNPKRRWEQTSESLRHAFPYTDKNKRVTVAELVYTWANRSDKQLVPSGVWKRPPPRPGHELKAAPFEYVHAQMQELVRP